MKKISPNSEEQLSCVTDERVWDVKNCSLCFDTKDLVQSVIV